MKPRVSNPVPALSPPLHTNSQDRVLLPEPRVSRYLARQVSFPISQLQRLCCFSASLPLPAKSQDLDFENFPFKKKLEA